MDNYNVYFTRRVWIFVLSMLIILDCYFHIYVYYNVLQNPETRIYRVNKLFKPKNVTVYYKYPLVNGSGAYMDYEIEYNSSYYWFTSMKHLFKDLSADAAPRYPRNMSMCKLNNSLNPITVNKTEPELAFIEEENSDVAVGGYYAPAYCRPTNRVAIILPYRDRRASLYILLSYLHPLLKKQLLEYRIFVIEQFGRVVSFLTHCTTSGMLRGTMDTRGTVSLVQEMADLSSEKFNKGTLYNIAFLETQRFGTWHCLIFHDVDLVPEDERISYSCPEHPTHMAAGNDTWGNNDLHRTSFGGVMAITPEQYEFVNGYSNLYWDWGVEDDDFYGRLVSNNFTIEKYNSTIAHYATLPHPSNAVEKKRTLLLTGSRKSFRREDLRSTKYNLIKVTQENLYTHILADVNPMNIPLDPKSLIQRLHYNGKTFYGHK